MIKKYKILSLLFVSCVFLFSCGSVRDGLTLKKKENSEQFLIEKKKPLVMPPDFDKLPVPGSLDSESQKITDKNDQNFDLESIINKSKNTSKSNSVSDDLSSEIEKKINESLNKQ